MLDAIQGFSLTITGGFALYALISMVMMTLLLISTFVNVLIALLED